MIIGIAVGVVALMFIVFVVLDYKKKQKIRDQQILLRSTALELKKRDVELEALTFTLGKSKFGDAVECVDTLLERESSDEEMMEKLALVKSCLIKGDDSAVHVPDNLSSKNNEEAYILQNFGGVSCGRKATAAIRRMTYCTSARNFSAAMGVNAAANKFLANKRKKDMANRRDSASTRNFNCLTNSYQGDSSLNMVLSVDCLPEFTKLDVVNQTKMFELLSFSNLQKWDFNVFDVAAIDKENVTSPIFAVSRRETSNGCHKNSTTRTPRGLLPTT